MTASNIVKMELQRLKAEAEERRDKAIKVHSETHSVDGFYKSPEELQTHAWAMSQATESIKEIYAIDVVVKMLKDSPGT